MISSTSHKNRQTGSALLAVLWLSAALAAIAFSVATSVRAETERVGTGEEDVRAYYLAQGAIQRAILRMEWAKSAPQTVDGENPFYTTGQPRMNLDFPTGAVTVELVPEAAKLNINLAPPDKLVQLLVSLGADPDLAAGITAGILDWRSPFASDEGSEFDQYYMSLQPSFRARHASFEDIEELLSVQGMTPDLFYGTWIHGESPGLVPRGGMRDCVSIYGSLDNFDVNTVQPAVLAAVGAPGDAIQALVAQRAAAPFLRGEDLANFTQSAPELGSHLSMSPHSLYTLRATARLRRPDGSLSDMRRSVAALVKFMPSGYEKPIHVLRWYDRG